MTTGRGVGDAVKISGLERILVFERFRLVFLVFISFMTAINVKYDAYKSKTKIN